MKFKFERDARKGMKRAAEAAAAKVAKPKAAPQDEEPP